MAKNNVSFEWNDSTFHDILNSIELDALCYQQATKISAAAGEGFHAKHWYSNMKGGRVASLVVPDNYNAMVREATEKTLTKAAYSAISGTS